MIKKGLTFTSWESYNPPGFTYGSLDYAQSSAEEDRASTFEYMMNASKPMCLNRNQPVWRKAKTMSDAIDAAMNTVNPGTVEYWERHL